MSQVERVEFRGEGATLRGQLFKPEGDHGPLPVVIALGGMGGIAAQSYPFAPGFTQAGLAILMYDHRCSGDSDGEPRQLFDPWAQMRDVRHALTYLSLRPDVDETRMALWGISLGGCQALFTAATDRRVAALVSIIPPVSGLSAKKLQPSERMAEFEDMIYADRKARMQGRPAQLITTHGVDEPGRPALFSDPAGLRALEYLKRVAPQYRNEIAISTLDFLFEMEVSAYAERITAPLLMILASQDVVAPVEEARAMFERIPGPKQKLEIPGQHYEILSKHMPTIAQAGIGFLSQQLRAAPKDGDRTAP